jgi:methyl-accepting chemotaxis protein
MRARATQAHSSPAHSSPAHSSPAHSSPAHSSQAHSSQAGRKPGSKSNPIAAQRARAQGFALDLAQGGPDDVNADLKAYA